MADISALSAELRILIIEHLDRASDGSLHDRQASILEKEIRGLPKVNAALLHLSCVNRSFRSLAAPYLFRTLILRTTVKSGMSVNLIAGSKYGKFVKKLEFVGMSTLTYDGAPGPAPRHGELTDIVLPRSVEDALSNLITLPSLEAVSVEFTLHGHDGLGSEDEYPDNFLEIRNTHASFMDTVYSALARNPPKKIKSLHLPNLLAQPCPSWESKAWQTLLNGLTTFHLTLNHVDESWGVAIDGYNTLLPLLKPMFWDHLPNITHLTFSPSPNGFLGADFVPIDPAPLSFGAENFPNLEALCLDHVFVGAAIVDFMRQHALTLREVRMQHAFVARSNSEDHTYGFNLEPQTTWAGVFNALTAANVSFPKLMLFEVECSGLEEDDKDEQHPTCAQKFEEHGESPDLGYALVDYVSAEVIAGFDVEEQRKAIYSGRGRQKRLVKAAEEGVQADFDQVAYEAFMQIVRGNRTRLGLA
jgi:hypothetical protein